MNVQFPLRCWTLDVRCWTFDVFPLFRLSLLVSVCLSASLPAAAVELKKETSFHLEANEQLDDELWLLADDVSIAGRAEDDLLIFANTVDIGGTTEGDVWAWSALAATLSGDARQQVRVITQSLTVSGRVERSIAAAAMTVNVTSNAVIGGDGLFAADTIAIGGLVEGNLHLLASHVTLQGHVLGRVRVVADDIVVLPGTVIEGDFIYTSESDFAPGKGVTIDGAVERQDLPVGHVSLSRRIMAQAMYALAAFLAGLAMLRLFPAPLGQSIQMVRHARGRCLLAGTAALFLVPLAAGAGLLVPVTRPLGLMAGAAFFIMLYLGKIVIALMIGSRLLRYRGIQGFPQAIAALALGLAALYFFTALPTIGLWVWLLASTVGLGAQIMAFITRPSAAPPPVPAEGPPSAPGTEMNLDRERTEP